MHQARPRPEAASACSASWGRADPPGQQLPPQRQHSHRCRGKKAAEERLAGREKRVAALESELALARAEARSLRDERAGLRHELSRMDSTHGNLLAVRLAIAAHVRVAGPCIGRHDCLPAHSQWLWPSRAAWVQNSRKLGTDTVALRDALSTQRVEIDRLNEAQDQARRALACCTATQCPGPLLSGACCSSASAGCACAHATSALPA